MAMGGRRALSWREHGGSDNSVCNTEKQGGKGEEMQNYFIQPAASET